MLWLVFPSGGSQPEKVVCCGGCAIVEVTRQNRGLFLSLSPSPSPPALPVHKSGL